MSHKYSLNQQVSIVSDATISQASPDGFYDIVRLMPQGQDGRYAYRLRSASGERVALEDVLTPRHAADGGRDAS